MKKALFLALSLAFLLTACGETTLPDTSEPNPVDNTQATSLPESCLLYYDLGNVRGQIPPARAECGRRVRDLL